MDDASIGVPLSFFLRHCERSEVIQFFRFGLMLAKERSAVLALIASSLALLAMTRMTRALSAPREH